MSYHTCSCGQEFQCANTLEHHADSTGHPVVLKQLRPAPQPQQPAHSIEWALVVLANKRAEQENYEKQLTPPATPWWSRVKKLVGLAA